MTEAARTTVFLKALKARVRGTFAEVTKYNDRTSSGIPDASLTCYGRTVWMEFKHRKTPVDIPTLLLKTNKRSKLQTHRLWRLQYASHGRAFYVIFEPGRDVTLVRVLTHALPTFRIEASGPMDEIIDYLVRLCD